MKKILIIICLIVFIFSIAGVAAEDVNQTVEDTDNLVGSVDTLGVSLSDDDIVGSADKGTFMDLQNKINRAKEGSTINLENNYAFDDTIDSDCIAINKPIAINGNGFTIDGKNVGKVFDIDSDAKHVVLKDITFINTFTEGYGGAVSTFEADLTVSGCTFINSSTYMFAGGAIYVNGNLIVRDCNFVNCISGTIEGPWGGAGDFGGGAIFVLEGSLTAYN